MSKRILEQILSKSKTLSPDHSEKSLKAFNNIPIKNNQSITVPDEFDGVKCWKVYNTIIHNQGFCGGCWSIASTDTLSLRFNIQSRGIYNIQLSWPNVLTCTLGGDLRYKVIDNQIEKRYKLIKHPEFELDQLTQLDKEVLKDTACKGGKTIIVPWEYLFVLGVISNKCFNDDKYLSQIRNENPPLCSKVISPLGDYCYDKEKPAYFYRCLHYYRIKNDHKEIMKDIYKWGPISSVYRVYNSFLQGIRFGNFKDDNFIYKPTDQELENSNLLPKNYHAIVIIGWGIKNNVKYWLIKNSFGKDFGINGYFKILRGVNCCEIEQNVIGCIPDFHFNDDIYTMNSLNNQWAETIRQKNIRNALITNLTAVSGGIDKNTNVSRRSLNNNRYITINPEISKYFKLFSFKNFIAGECSQKKLKSIELQLIINPEENKLELSKRIKYVEDKNKKNKEENKNFFNSKYLTVILIIILIYIIIKKI